MHLIAENLSCRRGERLLFEDLSFELTAGAALLVTGPNGAGKSSLLRLITGFLAPEQGRVTLTGAGESDELGPHCHYLGHRDGLRAALTIRENLAFARDLFSGTGDPHTALEAVDMAVRIDQPVATLSAGQRRRAALARLMVAARPVWLLDEPTSALDARSQEMVAACLARHLAGGGLAVVASHLPIGVPSRRITLGATA